MPERYIQHPQGFGKALRDQLEQQGLDDLGFLKLWPGLAFGVGKASGTRIEVCWMCAYLIPYRGSARARTSLTR